MIEFASDEVDPLVRDIGLATSLLARVDDKTLRLNLDWFGDPIPNIKNIPRKRAELVSIVRRLLEEPIDDAPDADREWAWHPLAEGKVFVVMPKEDVDPTEIGFALRSKKNDDIHCYAYAPLVTLTTGQAPQIVFASSARPIEIVLHLDVIRLHVKVRFREAPTFSLTLDTDRFESLRAFIASPTARAVVDRILATSNVTTWLGTKIGSTSLTVGAFLKALGLLDETEGKYKLAALDDLDAKPPLDLALLLFARALQAFSEIDKPIVPIGKGGVYITSRARDDGHDLGLRAAIPDAKKKSIARLQAGAWLPGEDDKSAWQKREELGSNPGDPGVNFTFIHLKGSTTSFAPRIAVTSVGFDLAKSNNRPLIDIKGVTLESFATRFSFAYAFNEPQKLEWGGTFRLGSIGIPLANGVSGSAAKNPVAAALLSSGEEEKGADNEPINPSFTVGIARLYRDGTPSRVALWLEPSAGIGGEKSVVIPVQRALGPLYCHRVHIALPDSSTISLQIDAAVTVSGLRVELLGLTIGIPTDAPGRVDRYRFALSGLDITFESSAIGISAGLLETRETVGGKELIRYDGRAVITAKKWSLSALGSFATLDDGSPSLFVFAYYRGAIGGPAFFFVTGICAGVGYNRTIKLPPRDDVKSFPLLAGLIDPDAIGGPNATPSEALAKLSDWIAPLNGSYWFAAGVQFTSFELVKSNAILLITFGARTLIAILGVSSMTLPQKETGIETQFAYAELGLQATFDVDNGTLQITALLSPNSFVLDRACRLTGGFALYSWFGKEHNGDFVLTLGGYHPAFNKEAHPHYPVVPRLGFSWQVSDTVTVTGEAYFALTPTCVMGGGALSVQFHSGNLRAWFNARADFLLQWKPFWYEGLVSVSIGASYRLKLIFVTVTVKVELGASLEIWGPPTGGRVHIDWYIISFTISFGANRNPPSDSALDWSQFERLLPQDPAPPKMLSDASAKVNQTNKTNPCTVAVMRGGVEEKQLDVKVWIVRPGTLELAVSTVFPLSEIRVTNGRGFGDKKPIAIRPMKIDSVVSRLDVTLKDGRGNVVRVDSWNGEESRGGAPEALWGKPLPKGQKPPAEANVIAGQLNGLARFRPAPPAISGPPAFALSLVMSVRINDKGPLLPLSSSAGEVDRRPTRSAESIAKIRNTIASAAVKQQRDALVALLNIDTNDSMEKLAALAQSAYPNPPMVGALWRVA